MFSTILTWISRTRANSSGRRPPARYRPVLEDLEARRLLSFNFFDDVGNPGQSITLGPDGNLWFFNGSQTTGPQISNLTLDGTLTSFPLSTSPRFGFPGLTAGPDGNVWFTESQGELDAPSLIGRITPDGTVTEFSNLRVNSFANGIAAGADGNLWFTTVNHTGGPFQEVERITPDGTVTEFPDALGGGAIAEGPDGNIWFAGVGAQIGRITPDGSVTTFSFPHQAITGITAGPDGNLWVLASSFIGRSFNSAVVRVTPDGVATDFPLPDQNQGPLGGITAGSDGNVWFIDGNKLDQITPDGTITEISVPSSFAFAQPGDLTTGADGNLWFTVGNQIGQFVFDGIATVPTTLHLGAPVTAVAGQPVALTATVTSSAGVPNGTVLFLDNGSFLGSAGLDSIGQATLTASFDVGFHAISALYAGTPDFAPSGDIRGIQVSSDSGGDTARPGGVAVSTLPEVVPALGAPALDAPSAATLGGFVLRHGGQGATAAPLAQAVRAAAVDAHFVGAQADARTPAVANPQPAAAVVDAALAAARPQLMTAPPTAAPAADVKPVHHPYQEDRAEATAAALAGPLTADLEEVR